MSRLYRKPGIQKEWITSTDVTLKRTVDDAGSTSSGMSCSVPLTTTPDSGYSKRHCQRNPMTSTTRSTSASDSASASTERTVMKVITNSARTMSSGMTV